MTKARSKTFRIHEQTIAHELYKKLLALYPRVFREQLGESMEQTFNDLYKERETESGWYGFVLWIFLETALGIFRERLSLITKGDIMHTILTNLRSPALISFLLVLPFMILEWLNRRNFNEGFPVPLFVMMWLLPLLFILTGMPIIRNLRAGNSLLAHPILLFVRVFFLALLAWMWGVLVIDQLPCFLGVPNCD